MNEPPVPSQPVTGTSGELDQLQDQISTARAVLIRLLQDTVEAEARLSGSPATQLLEANEQLVLSALRAQTEADTATQALDEASRSAEHDALTQLPNRVLLLDRFTQAIADARRHGTLLACLFVDLDDFKQINDTLGHDVGDVVLQLVAQRLLASTRAGDTVSRHGGDEFVMLLTEVAQPLDAARVADKVIEALAAPAAVADQVLALSASIGIALYPADGDDAHTLITRADTGMYQAKRRGRGSFSFYSDAPTGGGPRTRPQPGPALAAEQQRRHAELREANEQLVLAALSAQDLQASAQLARRQQTEFVALVAHELRNPLAPIRMAASMLGRVGADPTLLPRLQGIIERQVSHMTRLVDDLVEVSHANTGQLRLQEQQADLADIVATAIEACRPALTARRHRFDVQMPAHALPVWGDPVRLVQVLSNLLDNAAKYTPADGTVVLTVTEANDDLVLTVSDNGIGITAGALPHVFEPFVRDTLATGFSDVGMGIGLTVVRALVQAHGGSVVASSAGTGLGSRFVVTLPRSSGPLRPAAEPQEVCA
ncbi:MAG: diguanylate cyclase [Burkholderiales bacterium]